MLCVVGYRPALNGIRGVAILAVLGLHAFRFPNKGGLGVDLFFVLSGFLITALLLDERRTTGTISLRAFYRRRALRLLPALAVMLAVYAAATALFAPERLSRTLVVIGLAGGYASNFAAAFDPGMVPHGLGHMWSLAQEEQFYLLWPLLLILLLRRWPRAIIPVLVTLICASMLERTLMSVFSVSHFRIEFGPDTRADPILIGCLCGVLYATGRLPKSLRDPRARRRSGIRCFALVVCSFFILPIPWVGPSLTLFAAAAGVLVLVAATDDTGIARMLAWSPLEYLGRISYSVYLWHAPMLAATGTLLAARGYVVSALVAAASIIVAAGSHHLVEQPLRHRPRRRRTTMAPIPSARAVEQSG